MNSVLLSATLAVGLSALMIWAMLATGLAAFLAVDHPNARSLHRKTIPRSGGIAIMLAIIGVTSTIPVHPLPLGLLASLAGLSWLDDRLGIAILLRLAFHTIIAALSIHLIAPDMPWPIGALSILAMVWSMNLFNFMDGANGLAGGMALFGFGFFGIAAGMAGSAEMAGMAESGWIIAMAAGGFLMFNFGQARIFMGDCGSIPLGFLAGFLGIWGSLQNLWSIVFPLLVFLPFIGDATATLFRRLLRGEAFWQAHREHYYQRLIRMGWSHKKTALTYYAWMTSSGLSALVALYLAMPFQIAILVGWLVAMVWGFHRIDYHWGQWQTNHQNDFLSG